mgnify:CR=1 FL=1
MNIVYLTNEYPPSSHGGIGNFIKEISESLVNLNNNVTVIGLYNFNKIEYDIIEKILSSVPIKPSSRVSSNV